MAYVEIRDLAPSQVLVLASHPEREEEMWCIGDPELPRVKFWRRVAPKVYLLNRLYLDHEADI